ncbi:MAG: hypothetical protein AAB131_14390, partial [Actinomycetota bacterium]
MPKVPLGQVQIAVAIEVLHRQREGAGAAGGQVADRRIGEPAVPVVAEQGVLGERVADDDVEVEIAVDITDRQCGGGVTQHWEVGGRAVREPPGGLDD